MEQREEQERYGTLRAWEQELGVGRALLKERLQGVQGLTGRNRQLKVISNGFYAESDVRAAVADILSLPAAADDGFFYSEQSGQSERYGHLTAWSAELGISTTTILQRLNGNTGVQGLDRKRSVQTFYAEHSVTTACADLLVDVPKTDEEGFLEHEGERYATASRWAAVLNIRQTFVNQKMKDVPGIRARTTIGQICRLIPESAVRELCATVLEQLPWADEQGFITIQRGSETVRYGSIAALARVFDLSDNVLVKRMTGVPTMRGKTKTGSIVIFYEEGSARKMCEAHLTGLPHADEKGFFELEGVRYATIDPWATELQVSRKKLRYRLRDVKGVDGKDSGGNIRLGRFYPENTVQACAEAIRREEQLPMADEDGFFLLEGKKYGSAPAWSKILEVSPTTVLTRLEGVTGITGRDKNNNIWENSYYAEEDVLASCKDDVSHDAPKAGTDNFITVQTGDHVERYATTKTWSAVLDLHFNTIKKRLRDVAAIDGKDAIGRLRRQSFYAESEVRQRCADLLAELPIADETGVIAIGGTRYATCNAWAVLLGKNERTITNRVKRAGITGITGKDSYNHILQNAFYAEHDIRSLFDDLSADHE